MREGRLTAALPSLRAIRERFRAEFGRLSARHKQLLQPPSYPVRLSAALQREQAEITAAVRAQLMR